MPSGYINKSNLHLVALSVSSYFPFEDNILIVVESFENNQLLEQLELYESCKEKLFHSQSFSLKSLI